MLKLLYYYTCTLYRYWIFHQLNEETLSEVGSQVLLKNPELKTVKVVFLPQVRRTRIMIRKKCNSGE